MINLVWGLVATIITKFAFFNSKCSILFYLEEPTIPDALKNND